MKSSDLPGRERMARPAILVVAPSHGFPSTKARWERPSELIRRLVAGGAACDLVVLEEKPLHPFERELIDELQSWTRRFEVVPHPAVDSFVYQSLAHLKDALSLRPRVGGRAHCPARLLSCLRSLQAVEDYRAVIVLGAQLARCLSVFPDWTEKLIDLPRIASDSCQDHAQGGRADGVDVLWTRAEELALLSAADTVLVGSQADAARLRELGFAKDLVLAPPTGGPGAERAVAEALRFARPVRPPRLVCLASETIANLDGIRWFRRQVFPRIVRAVPTCRLRLLGEAARHIEPGVSVDRIGWVERLGEEYRDAAVVVLPLRMGAGVRRRAVEALAHGKALATTSRGAQGTRLVHLRDAIVTDEPDVFAGEVIRALESDIVRTSYERRALQMARDAFAPEKAFRSLELHLGLEKPLREAAGALAGAARPVSG